MATNYNSITETTINVFRKIANLDESNYDQRYWDEPLTGEHFKLTKVDMVYLLFEIEKQFEIRIQEEYLISYGFSTINKIIDVVNKVKALN